MAFNFTFADNQRLGLQIVGANRTGTSEQPIGFKRAVVDNDNNTAGEVMYVGLGDREVLSLGLGIGIIIKKNGNVDISSNAGTPTFGVIVKDGNGDYIQTSGVAYVQVVAPLTANAKVYRTTGNKFTSSNSGTTEIIGAIALDPAGKISVNIKGTPTDLYPVYLNNAHL